MEQSLEHECPGCGAKTFTRIASTELHLGEKVKWSCDECAYGFVRINGAVDTSTA
jgi:ribosomal protein L37AE/L43A